MQDDSTVERFRKVAAGQMLDWRTEKEWRHPGSIDLASISTDAVAVFVPDHAAYHAVMRVNRKGWPVQIVDF
jgi:hypothetical protein